MENNSWIKSYRSLLEWGWYQDHVTKDLFIHCLLKANYQNKMWKGTLIKTGSFVTSSFMLGEELGFSRQQIRRAINNLISTNEITTKTTNKYTLIKVVNWGIYQILDNSNNQQNTNKPTNEQPTNNQQTTTTKELKKERKKEVKNKYGEYSHVLLTIKEFTNLKKDFPDYLERIERLDEYIAMKGVKYKDHNLVIRNWARKDVVTGNSGKAYKDRNKPKDIKVDWLEDYIKNME